MRNFELWTSVLREAEGDGASPGANPGAAAPEVTTGEALKVVPKVDWRAVKIAKQTARIAELEAAIPKPVPAATAAATYTEEEVERRANARANEMASAKSFTDQCLAAAEKGETSYGKEAFRTEVSTLLVQLRDDGVQGQIEWNSFLQAALDTGSPEEVLHTLAADPDQAARIYALPPTKRAIELDRLVAKERREVSATPKPLPTISSRSNSTVNLSPSDSRSDTLDSADWHARRAAEVAAKNGGRPGRLQPKSARA